MPYKSGNIIKGGATIIFNGQPVGWTRDALTIGIEDDKLRIDDVQQIVGVVDVRRTKFSFVVKANLYEFTLENIRIAWGSSDQVTTNLTSAIKTLPLTMSGDYQEGELIVYGKGESNVARTYKWYKAKLIECGESSIDAYGATVLPVTFQVLIHPDYTALGYIEQEYVPSSTVEE